MLQYEQIASVTKFTAC